MKEEWFSPSQIFVLLSERVEVEWAPDAGPLAPDHHDGWRIHHEEDTGAAAAGLGVEHCLEGLGGASLAALATQAQERTTHQAHSRVFRHSIAHHTTPFVVVLEKKESNNKWRQ